MKLDELKKAYDKEARLLEDLCACLAQERECLINGMVGELWPLREKKEKICERLDQEEKVIRKQLKEILASSGKDRPQWLILCRKRNRKLKLQAASRNAENMEIVRDVLDFIDGLVGVIAGGQGEPSGYGGNTRMTSRPRILFREA
ncbi:MAG TPA: hypothetical protein ENG73_09650 [Desulfobacterales bacterium]|nr:hypothetical protein [Desulfobacterales bacterium]